MKKRKISDAVVRRLPRYYRYLDDLHSKGIVRISSSLLGERMGITASQIRQDLSCFGEFGQQGYGYNILELRTEIGHILGVDEQHRLVVVGAGHLGHALLRNFDFMQTGFLLDTAFDVSPALIGTRVNNVLIRSFDEIGDYFAVCHPDVAVLTVPKNIAQEVAEQLVALGVRGIWNFTNTELHVVLAKDGKTDLDALKEALGDDAACFYLQQPNYFGQIEDAKAAGEIVHAAGAKFVMGVNPIACAILPTPRAMGADVVVGDGQPLGLDTAFGGPFLGFMATTSAMTRKLPGRIVGQTKDVDGEVGYVLTLSAREQHIRREKASSNICSNQALCAFTAGVYMAAMGEAGMKQCARLCTSKAHYFAAELVKAGCKLKYQGEFFHEFVTEVECPNCRKKILDALDAADILGVLGLGDADGIAAAGHAGTDVFPPVGSVQTVDTDDPLCTAVIHGLQGVIQAETGNIFLVFGHSVLQIQHQGVGLIDVRVLDEAGLLRIEEHHRAAQALLVRIIHRMAPPQGRFSY